MANLPRVDWRTADPAAAKEVSATVAGHYKMMPVARENGGLKVAFSSPPDVHRLDELRLVLGKEIIPLLATEEEIAEAVQAHYGIGAETVEKLTEGVAFPAATAGADLEGSEASVVGIVNQILLEAYRVQATDIHIEPYPEDLRVRYRIDGVLYDAKMPGSLRRFQAAITSRIKIMADLSIAEKRLPQDGRIKVRVQGQEMDLRVSTLPTPFGESIGIRLLTSRRLLDLAHLGFAEPDLKTLEAYLHKPHGIIFLTGPTGSGKTTTLYAFLNRINSAEKKIITMEDPVEYQMHGISQVQVNPKIGLTFAQGLRSMLRHDPDVMMVGEVRDLETAEIAIRVALTGHLVFSTLHTNDATGAIARLQDIGVESYLVSSSVLCVIAQRLVRLICPHCKRKAEEGFKGEGCDDCRMTGFQGRTVIYEIFPITNDIRALAMARAPANRIREKAIEAGMRTMRECGWEKVKAGLTTKEEVLRATIQEDV